MAGRILLTTTAWLAVAAVAEAQGGRLNALRIERIGEETGTTLDLKGFYYIGSPSYSKDGEWIAFDGYKGSPADAVTECWVVRSDGTQARRGGRGGTPRWSPDGKRLLFMREERSDLGRPGGDNIGIFVVNADGTGEERLLDGRWPEWSPDGTRIAFSVGGTPLGGARPMSRVCVANLDGTEVKEVAIGDCPSWSPDGKRIACCYKDPAMGAPMVRVVDLDSGKQSFAGYGWFRANWSADGKHLYAIGVIAAPAPRKPYSGMVRLAADGSVTEPFLPEIDGQSPCPSPDGKSVVFCTVLEQPGPIQ